MRIGFDATAIPENRVGAGNYSFNLVQALANLDKKNEFFIFAQPIHIREWGIEQPNFHFVKVEMGSRLQRLLWEQSGLPWQARHLQLDVLHSPHYTMPLVKPCKSIVTFHDMTFQLFPEIHRPIHRVFFPLMMQWSAQKADKLIAVSKSTKDDMLRLLEIYPERIVPIPEAASSHYQQLPTEQVEKVCERYQLTRGKYIYYVGALEPRKNLPVLIEAYAKIAPDFPDIPLVIAGRKGWMYDEIFKKVTFLKLEEKVRFLGYVPESDLIGLYNGTQVFVYPSRYEGFGLPVLEAMHCGAPVITTRISSMPEVAGEAALLVEPDDVEALSTALREILTKDGLARELSQRGLARAKNFSWERCAQETLSVYESIFYE